jgi:hypothetical protein
MKIYFLLEGNLPSPGRKYKRLPALVQKTAIPECLKLTVQAVPAIVMFGPNADVDRDQPSFKKKTSQENLTGYIFHYKQQLLGMIRLKIKLRPLAHQSSSAVSLDYAARSL